MFAKASTRQKMIAIASAAGLLTAASIGFFLRPSKPFSTLKSDEIQEALLYTESGTKSVQLSREEINQAVEMLNGLQVSHRDKTPDSNTLARQTISLCMIRQDHTGIVISSDGSTGWIISGEGWQADPDSARSLSMLAQNKADM